MSKTSILLDSGNAPCDSCQLIDSCANNWTACAAMLDYVHKEKSVPPSVPSFDRYDSLFGEGHAVSGYNILNRSQYLESLKTMAPCAKTGYCDTVVSNLYEASTLEESGIMSGFFSDYHWLMAVSKTPEVPLVMGALGYEMVGDNTYVSYLYVRDYYKRQGIGSDLLNMIEMHTENKIVLLPELSLIHI